MIDPIVERGLHMFHALAALKLTRGTRIVGRRDGTEITQPGKPRLLLTWEAAREFCNEMDEAEHG